ncbi:MAG: hypothetical protein M1833_006591 [Piccolia ochrophora]|nr:MAG: hypothetical protein M1833_006591 [Piccolia ochrophora]
MHFLKLLFAAALVLFSTASATCFGTGRAPSAASKSHAANNLDSFCRSTFLGRYQRGQTRRYCLGDGPNRWDFSIKLNDNNESRNMPIHECLSGLIKEIQGCARGGRTKYGNWEYTYGQPNPSFILLDLYMILTNPQGRS